MRPILLAAAITAAIGSAAGAQVVHSATAKSQSGPANQFTGKVTVRILTAPVAPGQASAGLVTFEPGARSNWHTHPAGQILYVTQGCGWTQEEGGPVIRICKGEVVQAKPGVKHWHGATDKAAMSHLAISETLDGKNVDWLEPVTAAQYHTPAN